MIARQAAIVSEDALALELTARAFRLTSGVARGDDSAIDVIEATDEVIRAKFASVPALDAAIDRASRFRGLARLPAPPQARSPQGPSSALRVFEETRPAFERATAAVLDGR